MILVDTSVWIDYLRQVRTPMTERLTALVESEAELVTTEPVIMELLAVADTPARADSWND